MIKRGIAPIIEEKSNRIDLRYDSLNIKKHSHTIFEGYYRKSPLDNTSSLKYSRKLARALNAKNSPLF